ncbi:MAG: ABC transporter permease, partial [Acidobacteriaceae bacterium]|nr:ABC transporter permease [Acidobacteriaceae bacterium]
MNGRVWLARIAGLFRQDRTGYLEEEIATHTEMLAAEYLARGMAEADARSAARRDLGNVTSFQEQCREQSGLPWLENFWRDLKFAVRTLGRNPAFTWSCTATLAVGLGAMTTVLCVVSAFLWKPLPYPSPERLVAIKQVDPRQGLWPFSEPAWLDLQQRARSLQTLAAYTRVQLSWTGDGDSEIISAAAVTPSFFGLFGVAPIGGRVFSDKSKEVVIGRALWERRWQGNRAVVGRAIALDGESYTVVGIADLPHDLLPGSEVLIPLTPKATESRTAHDIEAVGRLAAGVSAAQARAELAVIAGSMARQSPQSDGGWSLSVIPLSDELIGPRTSAMIWMIFGAVTLLWLLACANVAGLQLARNISRRHEMQTRQALGASAGRLFAQTLTENCLLAVAGSLGGTVLAQFALQAVRGFAADSWPRMAQVELTFPTIGIALLIMFATTLFFTAFAGRPAGLQGGREISRRASGRDALILAQVVMATVLVLCASLLWQSFLRLEAVDLGFDPDRLLTVQVSLPGRTYDDLRRVAFFRAAESRLARTPGIVSAGTTNIAPFSGDGTANRFRLEGDVASSEYRSAAWRAVTPGFFTTLGVPLKQGRLFAERDANGSAEVVIISESMARKFWPNQDPIGKALLWGRSGSPKTIVGIVGDLRDLAMDVPPVPTMFRPYSQLSDAPMALVIRTKADPLTVIGDVRKQIAGIDRDAALTFQPLRREMSKTILRPRVSLTIMAAFAMVALITAAFGLYGLISYRVNQRQQEIGMRLALGASP